MLSVFWGPRVAAQGKRSKIFGLVDLEPTLLDFAGTVVPPHMQGRSLLHVLAGRARPSGPAGAAGASDAPTGAMASRSSKRTEARGSNDRLDRQGPYVASESSGPNERLLLEMVGNPRWNMRSTDWHGLVTDRYKYAFYETGHEVLHDLHDDPYELENMAGARPDVLREMREQLLAELAHTREPYFDVLIEYGVVGNKPDVDIGDYSGFLESVRWKGGLGR